MGKKLKILFFYTTAGLQDGYPLYSTFMGASSSRDAKIKDFRTLLFLSEFKIFSTLTRRVTLYHFQKMDLVRN